MIVETTAALLGVTERAIKLVRDLRELAGGSGNGSGDRDSDGEVSDEVLRLALLDAEYNRGLLDVVKPQRGVPSDDGRLFDYARLLRLDAISALLLEWKPRDAPKRDWREGLRLRADWERIAEQFDEADDRNLLAVARFIVVRGQLLRALGEIDPAVRKKLHVRTRLRNLADANAVLHDALRSKHVLEYLGHARGARPGPKS